MDDALTPNLYPLSLLVFSLEYTFRSTYWALFGLSDSRLVELKGYKGGFTDRAGYIIFGFYYWGAVIVFLNMLIAMMTRSFEKITVSSR